MAGYGVEGIHPVAQAAQMLQIPPADPGAGFALAKAGQPGGPMHVSPFSAANYGANRLTVWDTSQFGANRGNSAVRGSFVDFNAGRTPYPQAGG